MRGLVQGVGFRPFVYALARECGLSGEVGNTGDGVLIEIEGPADAVAGFAELLLTRAPPLARIEDLATVALALPAAARTSSSATRTAGAGRTLVSPDVATCADCLAELVDPANRRYRHPFISCTNCGPRFTIVTGLPYDRPATTMAELPLCAACAAEYADPADRRFHAQTVACPGCGPTLTLHRPAEPDQLADAAIVEARRLLAAGAIVAVKGLGGYHLACDAADEAAVATLRKRKDRGDKPFAVMVADLDDRRPDRRGLAGRGRPAQRSPGGRWCCWPAGPAPGLGGGRRGRARSPRPGRDAGLHAGAPPAVRPAGGPARPAGAGDDQRQPGRRADRDRRRAGADPAGAAWPTPGSPTTAGSRCRATTRWCGSPPAWSCRCAGPGATRRCRWRCRCRCGPSLAVGGDLKNTFCVADGGYAWLSAHVGDMDDLATLQAFELATAQLQAITGVRPELMVADRHPGYRSSAWAANTAPSAAGASGAALGAAPPCAHRLGDGRERSRRQPSR